MKHGIAGAGIALLQSIRGCHENLSSSGAARLEALPDDERPHKSSLGGQLLTHLRKSPPYLAIAAVLLPGGLLLLPLVMVWRSGSTPTSNKNHRVWQMISWPTFWR